MFPLPTLVIRFAATLSPCEITSFRGAFIAALNQDSLLFHNHDESRLRYAYPLIQYKLLQGQPAVVAVGKGIDVVPPSVLTTARSLSLRIGRRQVEMPIASVTTTDHLITTTAGPACHYTLHNWLPLNANNYAAYRQAGSLVERINMLERVLVGNILSLLKGVGLRLDEQLAVSITDVADQHFVTYKGVRLQAFDISFAANISLPDHIGIGKNASTGCGVLARV